jgi:hypothetical protein
MSMTLDKQTVSEWRGMSKGHPVKVKNLSGQFKFMFVIMRGDEAESVCVFGGKANYASFRHVMPERIVKKRFVA